MSRRVTQERYAALRASLWSHPDVMPMSRAAVGVWALALSYCADKLTDGFVTEYVAVTMLAHGSRKLCTELVAAGFWSEVPGGYNVTGYLEHNASRSQLDEMADRKRAAGSKGGRTKAARVAAATADPVAPATQTLEQTRSKPLGDSRLETRDLEAPAVLPPTPQGGESGTPMDPFKPQRGILLRAHRRRYTAATGHDVPPAKNSPADIAELLPWLVGYAQRTGQSFEQAVEAILERWWRDPYAAGKGWPLWHLAKHVDEHAEALPPKLALAKATGGMVPVSSRAEHAADAAEGTAF